jgi:glycosyltransferase involved in cell wall biosynthesis
VIIDGYNGYSILLDDIENLVNKIQIIKQNEMKKEELGTNGYKLLIENFTYEKFIKKQKNLLESCI